MGDKTAAVVLLAFLATLFTPHAAADDTLWDALHKSTNTGRMFADLDYLSTELATRYTWTAEMELACDYALAEFQALGLDAWFDEFEHAGEPLKNVVAWKPGLADSSIIYVIGGHLDATSPDPWHLAPGAEDNGSGAVSVLEAARLLAPLETDHSIYFVCFTAEEIGLIGSEHFAAQAAAQGLDIRGMLNLDMVGYYDPADEDLWLEGFYDGVPSVWLMELLRDNARAFTDLSVFLYGGNGWGSDHVPFHNHGFPAVLSIENEWASYPCYHSTCDTVGWLDDFLWRGIAGTNVISLAQLAGLQAEVGAIVGEVALAGGGDPAGVVLHLEGTAYASRTSDTLGGFAWNALFPDTYTLIATHPECAPDTTAIVVGSGETVPVALLLQPDSSSGVADGVAGMARATLRANAGLSDGGVALTLTLPAPDSGRLVIYDSSGRVVRRLYSPGRLAAGTHTLAWHGHGPGATRAASGVYWARWEGRQAIATARILLVR